MKEGSFIPSMHRDGQLVSPGFWERHSQTVLVTGAYTPLGRRIVERLAHAGWAVHLLTPPGKVGTMKLPRRVFEMEGSLDRISDLEVAVRDCNRVLHLAECSMSRKPEDYRLHNVEYTRNLCQACKKVGVSQFVLFSSSAVDLRRPTRYGRSKKTAEDVLRGSGLPWVIVRPSLIVGRDGSDEYRWLRMAVRRFLWIPLPEGGHAVKRPVHEDDVAQAIAMLLQTAPSTVERRTYHLSGSRAYTTAEIIDLIAQEHHLPRRKILRIPNWLAKVGAIAADRFFHIPFEMAETLHSLVQDADHGIENAARDFQFQPTSLEGRLTQSAQYVRPNANPNPNPFHRITHGLSLVRSKRR